MAKKSIHNHERSLTVGELKELLKDVPDDFELTIEVEGMCVHSAEVDFDHKIVDICY